MPTTMKSDYSSMTEIMVCAMPPSMGSVRWMRLVTLAAALTLEGVLYDKVAFIFGYAAL